MDIQSILLIITTVINLGWGLLIFFQGKNKKPNLIFSSVVFSVVLWSVSMIGYRSSQNYILEWCRLLYVAAILIPLAFLYFNFIFPEGKKTNKHLSFLVFLPALVLIFLTVLTNLIITDAFRVEGAENRIVFGAGYIFYVLYIIGYFSWSFLILMSNQKKYTGIIRAQSRYIYIGAASASTVAMTTNLLLPWFNIFVVNWLGQVATFLWVSFTSYAIIKYRLMDIRVIARKTVVYFLSAGFVFGMFYLVTWLYNTIFGGVFNNGAYLLGLIIAPLFVLIFVWLNEKIKGVANKYLFFSLYSSQETMAKLTDELTNSIDLSKIVDSIVNSIKVAMQLDRAGILLIDQNDGTIKYKIAKVIGFNENNGISLVQDNFLTQYLEKTQKPLVRDELQMIAKDLSDPNDRQSFFRLSENMKNIEVSLCLPMIISNKLIGIIVLGSKISGDAYTNEDLTLLGTLSKQAAIAVDNARLYKEVQDFSKTLQQKVDEQTKEIKKAYEVEKQAHEELKKVDDAKTQFMIITNHHLRTPLTAVKWYIDLLFSGKYGKISVKSKDVLNKIKDSVSDGIKIVNDLLDVSQFQMGADIASQKSKVNLKNILSEVIKSISPEAEQKGIKLNLISEKGVPEITVDESKLKVVLANILDNAVKYTDKGEISIRLKSEGENAQIEIKDSGMGMSESEIKNLFIKTFERSKDAQQANVVGKGIGLYVSSKIIEAHNGKIWAESAGKGKGSTFIVELPIAGK
jgi:signal transduction histidine kinase